MPSFTKPDLEPKTVLPTLPKHCQYRYSRQQPPDSLHASESPLKSLCECSLSPFWAFIMGSPIVTTLRLKRFTLTLMALIPFLCLVSLTSPILADTNCRLLSSSVTGGPYGWLARTADTVRELPIRRGLQGPTVTLLDGSLSQRTDALAL